MLGLEIRPDIVFEGEKKPVREDGVLVVRHAPEIPWEVAALEWDWRNNKMEQSGVNRENCQLVIMPNMGDVTNSLYRDLQKNQLGAYPVAITREESFNDGEYEILVDDGVRKAESVYLIGSLLSEFDYFRAMRVADYYKDILNAEIVTLVSPFLGFGRGDKNVDSGGNYVSRTIPIRTVMKALGAFVDRIMVFESHSSATQVAGLVNGISVAPFTPCFFMMDELRKKEQFSREDSVFVRPDFGRNIAARRAERYLGIPGVGFNKKRLSGTEIEVMELTGEEQALVRGRKAVIFDDEASSMETIWEIANLLETYGVKGVYVCLAHCKFTRGWRDRIKHSLFKIVLGTDSRCPVGNIEMSGVIKKVSLTPLIKELIQADIEGVNFWEDERYRQMILQTQPEERKK